MKLDLRPDAYPTKARGRMLLNLAPNTAAQVEAMAKPRCKNQVVILAVRLLYAIIAGGESLLDEIGERLFLALPGERDVGKIRIALNVLGCAMERAETRYEGA